MSSREADIIKHVISVARTLPASALAHICEALEASPAWTSSGDLPAVCGSIGDPDARTIVADLLQAWTQQAPPASLACLAWALRSAAALDEHLRSEESIELVWTGPALGESTLRRTDQALLDVIQHADRELIVVTFVVYKIPEIADAVVSAVERGVRTHFVLESEDMDTTESALDSLASLADPHRGGLSIYAWPIEERRRDEKGRHGSLHVKCAVADDQTALVTSANLTEYAMSLNMELGVLIRGGHVPRQIADHVRDLVAHCVLIRVQ